MSAEPMQHPVPDWLRPASGYTAAEFLALPGLPSHAQLIDGSLVFMARQRYFHMATVDLIRAGIARSAPSRFRVAREMALVLSDHTVVEPDVMVIVTTTIGPDQTRFDAGDAALVVEVVAPDSAERDRDTKPHKYANAGIAHYWRIEQDQGHPVVHVYELDHTGQSYVATGTHRHRLQIEAPFPIDIELPPIS